MKDKNNINKYENSLANEIAKEVLKELLPILIMKYVLVMTLKGQELIIS